MIINKYLLQGMPSSLGFFFFNWDSLHARLNSYYEAWSYKEKKHEKIKACKESVLKEPQLKGVC